MIYPVYHLVDGEICTEMRQIGRSQLNIHRHVIFMLLE